MRLGFVSFDRNEYSKSIAHADELGFDYLELMMDGDAHRDQLERDTDALIDALATHDVDLLVHLPYPMLIGSPHRQQRKGAVEELKRCIEVAAGVGADKGVVHPDSYAWRRVWDRGELDSKLVPSIRELDEFAAERGFEICLENHYDGVGSLDINGFDVVLSETDASMTFDTGHAAISGMAESEMASFLSDHSDRVSHIHLNDTRHPDNGYRGKDEHLPLGYGALDFPAVLQPIRDGTWDGTVSIELDTSDFEYLETSKRRLDQIIA